MGRNFCLTWSSTVFSSFKVYAVDDRHLFVRNFRYDGTGPDAYFWVGNDAQPSPKGRIVPYPPQPVRLHQPSLANTRRKNLKEREKVAVSNFSQFRLESLFLHKIGPFFFEMQEMPTLKRMRNENVLLALPGNLRVSDIRWLSIWCIRFTVNYGEVYMPKDLQIPAKVVRWKWIFPLDFPCRLNFKVDQVFLDWSVNIGKIVPMSIQCCSPNSTGQSLFAHLLSKHLMCK